MNEPDARKLLFNTIDRIESPSMRGLLKYIFRNEILYKFCIAPGGRGRHHAFVGGLAYHTCHATILASNIVDHYIDLGMKIDKDIVLAGVILHDIGKAECYTKSADANKGWNYTKANDMFHHIPIGYGIVLMAGKEYNETTDLMPLIEQEDLDHLLHIILSHHGNKCWSSPVLPKTLEAYVVHSIEMMDGYVDSYNNGKIPDRIY